MDQSLAKDIVKEMEKKGIKCVYNGDGDFIVGEEKHLTPVSVHIEVPTVVLNHMRDIRHYFIDDVVRYLTKQYGK